MFWATFKDYLLLFLNAVLGEKSNRPAKHAKVCLESCLKTERDRALVAQQSAGKKANMFSCNAHKCKQT